MGSFRKYKSLFNNITWKWGMYEKEFAISENWWKANLVIANMRFLKGFGSF